jgi:hypothetical protein
LLLSETVEPLAAELTECGMPFGLPHGTTPNFHAKWPGSTVFTKPASSKTLGIAVAGLLRRSVALGLELQSASHVADARLRGHAAKILNWPEGWDLCGL